MAIINVTPGLNAIQNAVDLANEGDVILVEDGMYPEQVDINNNVSSKNNIRIVANGKNVILDGSGLGGFPIAFNLINVTGVEIKGFKIQNYNVGITVSLSGFNRIISNKIMEVNAGISISFSNGNLIWKNEVKDANANGLHIDSSSSNWILENELHGNITGAGVEIDRGNSIIPESNALIGNRSFNNGLGFFIKETNTLMLDNEAFDNSDKGIFLNTSRSSILINNKVKDNGGDGLPLSRRNNFASENEIKKNGGSGINIGPNSDFNIIQDNEIKNNQNNGITLVTGTNNNTIIRNDVNNNTPVDINDDGTDNNFVDNKCKKSDPSTICSNP